MKNMKGCRKGRELTYELCKDVCSHFKNITQVYRKDQAVAQKCSRMGWILDFFPDTKRTKKGRELTYEVCKEVCSHFENPFELTKKDPAVRSKCYETGWIYEFYPDMKRITRTLDYETCKKSASRFNTRMEFREGDKTAYCKSIRMGWIDDFELYSPGTEKYPEEYVINLAKKFKNHRDFRIKCPEIYGAALKRGTLDKCPWLEKAYEKKQKPVYSLYVYEFESTHTAYVGITVNKRARHSDHLKKGDSVADYATASSLKVPAPKYLREDMDREEARKAEKITIREYREAGWNMLNQAVGGSVGSLGSDYWTKERCIETARNYTLVKDLREAGYDGCWRKMLQNGWDKECPWLKRLQVIPGTWKNMSKTEASRIAKKCRNRTEFERKYRILYPIAKEKGWVDEWFPPRFEYKAGPKEVVAYELDGMTEIGRFPSMAAATRAFGGKKGNINNCCNGLTQSAYGKIFRFASKTDA